MPSKGSPVEAPPRHLHLLWIVADAPELPFEALDVFTAPDNDVFLSSVSAWEIAVKHNLGRLPLPEPPGGVHSGNANRSWIQANQEPVRLA